MKFLSLFVPAQISRLVDVFMCSPQTHLKTTKYMAIYKQYLTIGLESRFKTILVFNDGLEPLHSKQFTVSIVFGRL